MTCCASLVVDAEGEAELVPVLWNVDDETPDSVPFRRMALRCLETMVRTVTILLIRQQSGDKSECAMCNWTVIDAAQENE